MRLHVVRHGESVNNAGLIEVPDPPLTALGEAQASRLAASWRGQALDALICSPLWRALQTAEPLLAAARVGRTVGWPALVEWNRSSPLDGHPPEAIAARFPAVPCDPPLQDVGWPDYPGSETEADVLARAASVLRRLVAEFPADARLAVVAHQGFDGALLCAALGADLRRVRFGQGNCRVHTLELASGAFTLRSANGDPSWIPEARDWAGAQGARPLRTRPPEPGELDVYLLAGELAADLAAVRAPAPWAEGPLDAVVAAGARAAAEALAGASGARLEVWSEGEPSEAPGAIWDRLARGWPSGGRIAVAAPAPVASRLLAAAIGADPARVALDGGSFSHVRRQQGRVTVWQANAGLRGLGSGQGAPAGAVGGPS